MISEKCGKSSAPKAVKGFTLIELLIVMAIIAILAGISSMAIVGFIRDSRLETANSKAQQVLTATQNALIQMEIYQSDFLRSPDATAKKSYLEFYMADGEFADVKSVMPGTKFLIRNSFSAPVATEQVTNTSPKYDKLVKYIGGNLSSDFTGYCLVAIDLDNYTVASAVFTDDDRVITDVYSNNAKTLVNYSKEYTYSSAGNTFKVYTCKDYITQRKNYSNNNSDNSSRIATVEGISIGYYPFADTDPTIT